MTSLLNNIQIGVSGANEIDTAQGNLIIDATGQTIIDDSLEIKQALEVDGLPLLVITLLML